VDLGLIYACRIDSLDSGQRAVSIEMTLMAPGCGMGEVLVQDILDKLRQIPSVAQVRVELVFDPPWSLEKMSTEARLQAGLI
jgi:metal-sulfur cluster biosynthetic enzyme